MMTNVRCDDGIRRSATQLALQLMITFIMLIKPTQACFSSGPCCPQMSAVQCAPSAPPCLSSSSYQVPASPSGGCGQGCGSSGSSYLGPPPPAPLGIGVGNAYMHEPPSYISDGSGPSYGSNGIDASYQSAQNSPPSGGSFYPGGGRASAIDSIPHGYGASVGGSKGEGESPSMNIPSPGIPLPPLHQNSFDSNSMQYTEEKLKPIAAQIQPDYIAEEKQKFAPYEQQSVGAYQEAISDHEGAQQQQRQQQYQQYQPDAGIDQSGTNQGYQQLVTGIDQSEMGQGYQQSITGIDQSEINQGYQQSVTGIDQSEIGQGYQQSITGIDQSEINQGYQQPVTGIDQSEIGQGYQQSITGIDQSEINQGYQQSVTEIDQSEIGQGHVRTDDIASITTDSTELFDKYEQSVSETSNDVGANIKSGSTYQSESYSQLEITPAPVAKSLHIMILTVIIQEYHDTKDNKIAVKTIAGYGGTEKSEFTESRSIEVDDSVCNDPVLKAIIESTLEEHRNNLDAARSIESKASKRFGGRFNSIISDSEFAYVNWYGKRNCQLQVNGRHSLTWED